LKEYIAIFILSLSIFSCSPKIPLESVTLNRSVGKGIETLKRNAITAIDAWEESSLFVIEQQWNKIYSQAEKLYWSKRTKPDTNIPTEDQYSEIAALANLISKKLGDKVRVKANEMKKIVVDNSEVVKDINLQVTELLSSASRILEINEALINRIESIIPLPIDALKVQ